MKQVLIGAVVAGLAAVLLVAAPALAAKNGSISVSPSTISPGGTVHISGSIPVKKCPASDSATVTATAALFPPDGFGPSATRDSSGAFALDYTVPTSTPAGAYEVGLRCGGGNVGISASLTVTVPGGGPATGGGGASHGSRSWTAFGIGCLALGGIALAVRRRLAQS